MKTLLIIAAIVLTASVCMAQPIITFDPNEFTVSTDPNYIEYTVTIAVPKRIHWRLQHFNISLADAIRGSFGRSLQRLIGKAEASYGTAEIRKEYEKTLPGR